MQNVAAGQITKESTDAVNDSQLYSTNNVLSNFSDSVKTIFGGGAALQNTGNVTADNITFSNIGEIGKHSIHDAIKHNLDENKKTNDKLEKLSNNTLSLSGDTGETTMEKLNKEGGLKFRIKGSDSIRTMASGNDVSIDLSYKTKLDISKGVAANSGVSL